MILRVCGLCRGKGRGRNELRPYRWPDCLSPTKSLLQQGLELLAVELFLFHEGVGKFDELVAMILQQGAGYGVAFVKDALHLKVDGGGHRYAAGLVRAWGEHGECMLASGYELAVERLIATLVGDQ